MTHLTGHDRVSLAIVDDCDATRGYLGAWIETKVDDVEVVHTGRSDVRRSDQSAEPEILIVGEVLGGEPAIAALVDGQVGAGRAVVVVADEALVRVPVRRRLGSFMHLPRHASLREVASAVRRAARQVRDGADASASLDVDRRTPGAVLDASRRSAASPKAPTVERRRAVTNSKPAAARGRRATALSVREVEAVRIYVGGATCREVAELMGVTPESVRTFLRRARAKYRARELDAGSRMALRARAVEDGLLAEDARTTSRRRRGR